MCIRDRLNTQGFEKIMKKYDKFMGLRHTPGAKSPDFEARLRGEVFKSERLDACLEKFKATRSQLSSDVGALEMKLISGSANKPLAEEISARLGVPLSPAKVRRFNDGEVNIQLCDSVRGCNVYIVQPTCPPVNDHLVELLLLISAARRASAASVTAVVPYYGYARQLCGNQIFNPTSMCAYATVSTQGFLPCFENSTKAIDASKNQTNRRRFDRDREF